MYVLPCTCIQCVCAHKVMKLSDIFANSVFESCKPGSACVVRRRQIYKGREQPGGKVELQTSSMSDLEPSTPSKHPLHVENPKTLTAQTQQSQQHTHTRKHTHTHTQLYQTLHTWFVAQQLRPLNCCLSPTPPSHPVSPKELRHEKPPVVI